MQDKLRKINLAVWVARLTGAGQEEKSAYYRLAYYKAIAFY